MTDWRTYWRDRSHAEHRGSDPAYFEKHASEKLLHLGSGDGLLDVGCGAADLLVHYAPHFRRVVGVDFSPAMVEAARTRIASRPDLAHVQVGEADDATVWDIATGTFDCITAGGVVQYWAPEQLERFVTRAFERLSPTGRLVLFEIIDPRLYPLHALGLFRDVRVPPLALASQAAKWIAWAAKQRLLGQSANPLGRGYRPSDLAKIAHTHGLQLDVAWSMYYEYRFHAILRRPH